MAGELTGISIGVVTGTIIDGTNYLTVSVTSQAKVGSYVALREMGNATFNSEFEVLRVIAGALILRVEFAASTVGYLYEGPSVVEFDSWIVPSVNPNQTELSYLTWDAFNQTWNVDGTWSSLVVDAELPTFRHNFASDTVVVTARLYSEGFTENFTQGVNVTVGDTIITTSEYLPLSGGIKVFKKSSSTDRSLLALNVDYAEIVTTLPPSNDLSAFATEIKLGTPIISGDVIDVVHTSGTLIEDLHYTIVNANVIQLRNLDVVNIATHPGLSGVTIWGLTTDEDAQNPARLIDKSSKTVVSAVQIWDPARGDHYTNAIHNIDLLNILDPATYNVTDQIQPDLPNRPYKITPWTDNFIGTTWLDTTNLQYVPYYDEEAIPDLEERLRDWGQLADWGQVSLYEWVKSDVLPVTWNTLAASEEGDTTIPEGDRKSGIARKTLYELVGIDWVEIKATIEEFDAVVEGTDVGGGLFDFVTTKFTIGDVVDVYKNGKLVSGDFTLVSLTVQVEATISDRIRVMKQIPTDRSVIDAAVEAGQFLENHQYVEVTKHDSFGIGFSEYFFWVEGKGTKPSNKERTDTIKGVATSLVTIPVPYMFFQGLKSPSTILLEGDQNLQRIEQHTATVGQTSIPLQLPIAPGTAVMVTSNGVPIMSTNLVFETGGRIVSFPSDPQAGGENLQVFYTGLFDRTIKLDHRFTQMVSRGLRGIVDADRRYTLRYTRDFTLRDDLEAGKTPLELKDLHAEWEMFREEQPYHINRSLWDKITESIVQYRLTDATIRVPSYERELFDDKYDRSTQYGLGEGQAFVSGTLALASILFDLENPENNFQPVDINAFFSRNTFDSPAAIVASMDEIYTSFAFTHVNRMFFSVLLDALSSQTEYADLIKTSMVSLHGVVPFVSGGVFDS